MSDEPKYKYTPETAAIYRKLRGTDPPGYKSETPKLSKWETAYQTVYSGHGNRADSLALGLPQHELSLKKAASAEARAAGKEKRDIALYGERIKKLRTDTTKEPDYMKKAETLSTKIANIDKSLEEMTQQFEKSPEVGTYVKKTVGGEPAYKPAVSEERKTKLLGKKEQLIKQQQITERNAKIQLYANKKGIPAKELVSKFDRFEQISQEVEGNPDKYISGVILDQNKRKQALLDIINKRAASEIGIDIDDVEKILNIKIK